MTLRRSLSFVAVLLVAASFSAPTSRCTTLQHANPYYDCTVQSPCGNATQACLIRWGRCVTGKVDGEGDFHDPNHDGCGCDLGPGS